MDAEQSNRSSGAKRVVLGLGNPGAEYDETRHNVGFRVVQELARRRGLSGSELVCNAVVLSGGNLLLVAPQTYMNRSGYSARCLLERYELEPSDFLVVYDDVHLPLGKVRYRRKGGPGGHRGMESIVHNLRTEEVPRLRLGVGGDEGSPGGDLVDYVLGPFTEEERPVVDEMIELGATRCEEWIEEGFATSGSVSG